ncbi:Integrator complex subunit 3 [Smittium mucronatum]|uniref:Integrator complex subunit 3 n=1 Tax=Smittium mucronatum TaxID=133383 RepID=A0A1R0H1N3_9FUNG|nr:Integrator complex subunit 3 [Smittium mucronatum]
MNSFQRNLVWFSQEFLSTPESGSIFCDIIRFICGVFHPTNQQLASDLVPRYVILGALFRMVRSPVAAANIKLSLVFDFMFFNPQYDNIMNIGNAFLLTILFKNINSLLISLSLAFIEPFILLIERSLEKYSYLTCTFIEFLSFVAESYSTTYSENIKKSVLTAMSTAIEKGVISSLNHIYIHPRVPTSVKLNFINLFPSLIDQRKLKKQNKDISAPDHLNADSNNSDVKPLLLENSSAPPHKEIQKISLNEISHVVKLSAKGSTLSNGNSHIGDQSFIAKKESDKNIDQKLNPIEVLKGSEYELPNFSISENEISVPHSQFSPAEISKNPSATDEEISFDDISPESISVKSENIHLPGKTTDDRFSEDSNDFHEMFRDDRFDDDAAMEKSYGGSNNMGSDDSINSDKKDPNNHDEDHNGNMYDQDMDNEDYDEFEEYDENDSNYDLIQEKLQLKSLWIFGSVPSDLTISIESGDDETALIKLKELFQMYIEAEVSASDLGPILGLILQNTGLEDVEMNREFELDNNETAVEHDLIHELCVLVYEQCKDYSADQSDKESDLLIFDDENETKIPANVSKSLDLLHYTSSELPPIGYRWFIFVVLKNERPDLYKLYSTGAKVLKMDSESPLDEDSGSLHKISPETSHFISTFSRDLSLFRESLDSLFYQSLHLIYKYFPKEIEGNHNILFVIAKSIMQPQLHRVLFLISTSNLVLFGYNPSLVIPYTIDWESSIQISVWQMMKAEISLEGYGAVDLVDYLVSNWNIDWSLHSETANGIFQILSSSSPHIYVLSQLIYLTTLSGETNKESRLYHSKNSESSIKKEEGDRDSDSDQKTMPKFSLENLPFHGLIPYSILSIWTSCYYDEVLMLFKQLITDDEKDSNLETQQEPMFDVVSGFMHSWSKIDSKISHKIDEIKKSLRSVDSTSETGPSELELLDANPEDSEIKSEIKEDITQPLKYGDPSELFDDIVNETTQNVAPIFPKFESSPNNCISVSPYLNTVSGINKGDFELFGIGSNDLKPSKADNGNSFLNIKREHSFDVDKNAQNFRVLPNNNNQLNIGISENNQAQTSNIRINSTLPLSSFSNLPIIEDNMFIQKGNFFDHNPSLKYANNNSSNKIQNQVFLNNNQAIFPKVSNIMPNGSKVSYNIIQNPQFTSPSDQYKIPMQTPNPSIDMQINQISANQNSFSSSSSILKPLPMYSNLMIYPSNSETTNIFNTIQPNYQNIPSNLIPKIEDYNPEVPKKSKKRGRKASTQDEG